MADNHMATFVALRQGMINDLKLCWAGASGAYNDTMGELASSIADVLLEISPDTDTEATTAIYADAQSIARDVIASSTRKASVDRIGSATEARA